MMKAPVGSSLRGDRQQKRDGERRADAGQDADGRAERDADQAPQRLIGVIAVAKPSMRAGEALPCQNNPRENAGRQLQAKPAREANIGDEHQDAADDDVAQVAPAAEGESHDQEKDERRDDEAQAASATVRCEDEARRDDARAARQSVGDVLCRERSRACASERSVSRR